MNVNIGNLDRYEVLVALLQSLNRIEHETRNQDIAPAHMANLEEVFSQLANSKEPLQIINDELMFIRDSPSHRSAISSKAFRIANSERFALLLTLHGSDLTSEEDSLKIDDLIFSFPGDWYLANLGPNNVRLKKYPLPDNWSNDIFDQELKLGDPQELCLEKGDSIYIDSKKYIAEYDTFGVSAVLTLLSRNELPLNWAFDKHTFRPVSASPSTARLGRIQQALQLGAEMVDDNAEYLNDFIDHAKHYMNHPVHFVRWAAVSAACYVDSENAENYLKASLTDVHPHNRRAAERTLNDIARNGGV
jgi:hypothetical protein